MSGFELKEVSGRGKEPKPAGPIQNFQSQNIQIQTPRGSSACEAAELLASRFEFLAPLSDDFDVSSYLVRDLRASAVDDPAADLVVLKILDGRACDQGRLALFKLEARAAAKLSHRSIVGSSAAEELNGVHFSIHEYHSDVETLKDLLDRRGWLDLRLALGIIKQISDALQYAHAQGVLHLRIHPENILIDPDGTAVLADFGIEDSRELTWAHQERTSQCPLRFASPEQASGKAVDARSDQYSLGVVLYQMLTDRLPLDSEDPNAVRQKQLTQTPLPPHLYFDDIPTAFSETIARMLERDPAKRFPDVISFQAALDKSFGQGVGEFLPSGDSTEQIERQGAEHEKPAEVCWEDETTPIDLEVHDQAEAREKWDPPTITIIDPFAAELVCESQFAETAALARASTESSQSLYRVDAFPENGLREHPANSARTRPVVLVLALATAAIVALIGLAFAARMRISNGFSPESLVRKESQGKSIPDSATSSLPTGDKATVSNRQPAANLQIPEKSASQRTAPLSDGKAKSQSSQITKQRITRPSSWRQVRRKSRRAERYEVRYRSTRRRYYRSGER